MKKSIQLLQELQTEKGLFIAAPSDKTGYGKAAWIRDNIYATLGLESISPEKTLIVYHTLLDIMKKHQCKIEWAIKEKPLHKYQYIHARYDPITLEEFWEDWGNKQNDAVGAFLFKIADLIEKGLPVIRNREDEEILEKIVSYLESIEYWHDKDNGMWEENEEIHASSVGACLAGLIKMSKFIKVPQYLIEKGRESLNSLLPRESETKKVDLALLSLIYPYNILSSYQKQTILENVEKNLVKNKGVIRYIGDNYYNKNGEAEWTMGFPWLAIIYKESGNKNKFEYYMKKTLECMNEKGELPELYFSNSEEHNENSPLGWAQSLYLVAAL